MKGRFGEKAEFSTLFS